MDKNFIILQDGRDTSYTSYHSHKDRDHCALFSGQSEVWQPSPEIHAVAAALFLPYALSPDATQSDDSSHYEYHMVAVAFAAGSRGSCLANNVAG